jgi:hypothetical protein
MARARRKHDRSATIVDARELAVEGAGAPDELWPLLRWCRAGWLHILDR